MTWKVVPGNPGAQQPKPGTLAGPKAKEQMTHGKHRCESSSSTMNRRSARP